MNGEYLLYLDCNLRFKQKKTIIIIIIKIQKTN